MKGLRKKKVLIMGGSGLIGQYLLSLLLKDAEVESVTALVRSPLKITHPKLYQVVTQFEKLIDQKLNFKVDTVFCALGSTMAEAKTKSGFKRCDYHYVVEAAKLAQSQGVDHFIAISAVGANSESSFFYNKIKGEMERDVYLYGPAKVTFIRPSLLLGKREEKRPLEEFSQKILRPLSRLFIGPLKKYRPVESEDVALFMYQKFRGSSGQELLEKNNFLENITMAKEL